MQTFMNTKTVLLEIKKHTPNLLCLTKSGWLKLFPSHPRHNPTAFFFKKLRSDGYGCSDMFGKFVNARLLTDSRVSKNEKNNMSCLAQALAWTSRRNLITLTAAGLLQVKDLMGKLPVVSRCASLDPKPLKFHSNTK